MPRPIGQLDSDIAVTPLKLTAAYRTTNSDQKLLQPFKNA